MAHKVTDLFTAHPASVDETYLQHLGFALRFSGWLILAGMAALLHALLPFLFEKTASNIINTLHHRIHKR
ncbi:hypothetical protein GCM10007939_09850 [Amylibacter marinus]|uniref:Capsule biosynthesis protein n=1 Tax=Amylibacter marinus TaxID=1475483 RepID=A0ABQ5VTX7_9RHOB|nr:DUF6356 family protein [Amylibacter marinus]GLQ34702.1 hypothetical protein GCM10007939_09850 [Amylibacter marinus]